MTPLMHLQQHLRLLLAIAIMPTHFHPYRSAKIMLGKDCVGLLGDIHPQYGKNIVMAELDFDALIDVKKSKIKFSPVSKYPSVSRDLAFVLDRAMPVQKVVDTINKHRRRASLAGV